MLSLASQTLSKVWESLVEFLYWNRTDQHCPLFRKNTFFMKQLNTYKNYVDHLRMAFLPADIANMVPVLATYKIHNHGGSWHPTTPFWSIRIHIHERRGGSLDASFHSYSFIFCWYCYPYIVEYLSSLDENELRAKVSLALPVHVTYVL